MVGVGLPAPGQGPSLQGGGRGRGLGRREQVGTEVPGALEEAILPGHQPGFKNANGTRPLKYASCKGTGVAAGVGAGVESRGKSGDQILLGPARGGPAPPVGSVVTGPGNTGFRDLCPTSGHFPNTTPYLQAHIRLTPVPSDVAS